MTLRRIISAALAAIAVMTLASCGKEPPQKKSEYYEKTFFAMDTLITVRLARATETELADEDGYLTDEYLASVADGCEKICTDIEATFSRTLDDSTTARLNTEADMMLDVPEEFTSLLTKSLMLAEMTGGAFDPTIGTLSVLWNITGGGPVPSDDSIADALGHVGYGKITVDGSTVRKADALTMVDFGGIAKGYAAQKMLEYLSKSASMYGLVSVGGNIGVFGEKPDGANFKVGIASPDDASAVIGYAFIGGGFIAVSGDYERYFISDGVRYHHIFDSSTGAPAKTDIRSAAVIASSGTLADALSTALFVMGYDEAMEFYGSGQADFEAVFVLSDGRIMTTPGLSDGGFIMAGTQADKPASRSK